MPPELAHQKVRPDIANFNANLGEFILKYEDLRREASPDEALLEFLETTYSAAAEHAAKWDRAALER